jgi:hypothetical protein
MCKSEVARLRQQIALEMEAMHRGMSGLSEGSARHAFIHARMERIGACQDVLTGQVGAVAANQMVCQLYIQTMDADQL